jgi:hypothetical protein
LSNDSKIPQFITVLNPEEIDIEVEKQTSAIYRGIMNLIVLSGALDFKTGNPLQFSKEKIQEDHIFPKSKFKNDNGKKVNTIANKTLITTNSIKSSKIPSEYFQNLVDKYGIDELKRILATHLISEKCIDFLLRDDLDGFVKERKATIISKIREKLGIENFTPVRTLITPGTPFSNKLQIRQTIDECDGYIYWIDKYFSVQGLELLSGFLNAEKIKYLKILMSPEKADRKIRTLFKDFKKEMRNKGISCELRVITNSNN